MSSPPSNDLRTALNHAETVVQPPKAVLSPIRLCAFWVAIALPFLYLPLLVTGLGNAATTMAFLSLLGANAVALLVGHSHYRN